MSDDDQKETSDAERIFRDGQRVIDDSKRLADDVRDAAHKANPARVVGKYYQDNPFAVLAGAAGVGYLLGGGLFTPFTKRMLKIGMKALVVPLAASQLRNLSPEEPANLPGEASSNDS
jgi:ElaB/YqjD/DUF883 family membrane-anchored ribosome-binding protein